MGSRPRDKEISKIRNLEILASIIYRIIRRTLVVVSFNSRRWNHCSSFSVLSLGYLLTDSSLHCGTISLQGTDQFETSGDAEVTDGENFLDDGNELYYHLEDVLADNTVGVSTYTRQYRRRTRDQLSSF